MRSDFPGRRRFSRRGWPPPRPLAARPRTTRLRPSPSRGRPPPLPRRPSSCTWAATPAPAAAMATGSASTAAPAGRRRGRRSRWSRIWPIPSFLIVDRQGRHLYSAHGDGTQATSYQIDQASGRLTLLNQQPTGGGNGVHLAIDATGRFLALANYATGSLAVLPINADGVARRAHRPDQLRRPAGPASDAAGELASASLSRSTAPAASSSCRTRGSTRSSRLPARQRARHLDARPPCRSRHAIGRRAASRRLPPDAAVRLRDQRARLDDRHVSASIRRTACSSRSQVITTLPPSSHWQQHRRGDRRGALGPLSSTAPIAGTTASPSSRSTPRKRR